MPVLLALLVALVVEVAVVVTVGGAIGLLPTLALLLLAGLLGAWLLRREGVRTLGALNDAVRSRRVPQREVADGVLLAAAAVLVVLPGFVSDVLGLLLLLPPTRAVARRWLLRAAERRAVVVGPFPGTPLWPGERAPFVDGDVLRVDRDDEWRRTDPDGPDAVDGGPARG